MCASVDRSIRAAASLGSRSRRSINAFHVDVQSLPSNAILTSVGNPIGTMGGSLAVRGSITSAFMGRLPGSSCMTRRHRTAARPHGGDQRIDIAMLGAVIDDGGADREVVADPRGRRRADAGLVEIGHDPGIEAVRI